MRNFILFILFVLSSHLGYAQSITISEHSSTANNNKNEFLVAGHQVSIDNTSDSFSLNKVTAISASLSNKGVTVFSGNGNRLFTSGYKAVSDDESVKVYVKPNGGFIIRENIANFLFYDTRGKIKQSVSNSSQSTEGESISELAADPAYKTVVIYNPKIVRNGVEGSRARVVKNNWATRDVFYSSDRAIRSVKVSDNGQYIAIITYKSGTDDEVRVTDRFGNELGTFTFNQNIADVIISDNGEHVTIRSNSRVGVYSMLNGEREGSTSFRSMLQFAKYVPQDETIIAVTADRAGSVLSNVEIHAINLTARSIERQGYSGELGVSELVPVELKRTSSFRYLISGFSKSLSVNVQF